MPAHKTETELWGSHHRLTENSTIRQIGLLLRTNLELVPGLWHHVSVVVNACFYPDGNSVFSTKTCRISTLMNSSLLSSHLSHDAPQCDDGSFGCSTGHQSLSDSLGEQEGPLGQMEVKEGRQTTSIFTFIHSQGLQPFSPNLLASCSYANFI